MVQIDIMYLGDLHCRAIHGPSGQALMTDAPTDNQGKGEFYSPTDLVGTSMGTCVATIMGIYARNSGIDLEGMKIQVRKVMSAQPPRRIAKLEMIFQMPPGLSPRARKALEICVDACPVRRSLHPDVETPVSFEYPD
jgi:putative redox protein